MKNWLKNAGIAAVGTLVASTAFFRRKHPVEHLDPVKLILPTGGDDDARFLHLEGAVNFRDIGGYPTASGQQVRTGLVYRSGSLGHLTESALIQLQAMDIKLVCDFRSQQEMNAEPDRLPQNPRPFYLHSPLVDPNEKQEQRRRFMALLFNRQQFTDMLPEYYTRVAIDANAHLYGDLLRRLSDPANLPAIFHCAAGKDRTGIAAALLLRVLGVAPETVIADYSLSNRFHQHFYEAGQKAIQPLVRFGMSASDIQPILLANPENMRITLAHIDQHYGSVERYLTSAAGLDATDIARLRSTFLT
jgi:protein-tyrosine phosphatase